MIKSSRGWEIGVSFTIIEIRKEDSRYEFSVFVVVYFFEAELFSKDVLWRSLILDRDESRAALIGAGISALACPSSSWPFWSCPGTTSWEASGLLLSCLSADLIQIMGLGVEGT